MLADRCRLVVVLGLGGIGKTTLTARLAQEVAPHFEAFCWRSLRNAPQVEDWLAAAIRALSPFQAALPSDLGARLGLLLELLRQQRALLVLDNLETILQPGEPEMRYRPGYEGYGAVLRLLGESVHQGCLLVTGREEPPGLAPLVESSPPCARCALGVLTWRRGVRCWRTGSWWVMPQPGKR